jgi:hypothetical protein
VLALSGVGVGDAEADEASAGIELLEPGRGIGADGCIRRVSLLLI